MRKSKGGNFTTSKKVNAFMPLIIQYEKIVTWNFCMNESSEDRYNIILGRDIFMEIVKYSLILIKNQNTNNMTY